MATTIVTSGKFSLDTQDFLKGALLAVLTPVLTTIYTSIEAGNLSFNWKAIGITALGAFLAYLTKNFFAPAKIQVENPPQSLLNAAKNGNVDVVKTSA